MLKYYFFLLTADEARDPNNKGHAYAIKNKARWVEAPKVEAYLTVGHVKGMNYIVKDKIVYDLGGRCYIDIDENYIVFICVPEESGPETKVFK